RKAFARAAEDSRQLDQPPAGSSDLALATWYRLYFNRRRASIRYNFPAHHIFHARLSSDSRFLVNPLAMSRGERRRRSRTVERSHTRGGGSLARLRAIPTNCSGLSAASSGRPTVVNRLVLTRET